MHIEEMEWMMVVKHLFLGKSSLQILPIVDTLVSYCLYVPVYVCVYPSV